MINSSSLFFLAMVHGSRSLTTKNLEPRVVLSQLLFCQPVLIRSSFFWIQKSPVMDAQVGGDIPKTIYIDTEKTRKY
jgi:hypothetical protein